MLIALFVIGALVLILNFSRDLIDRSQTTQTLREVLDIISLIDSSIKDVVLEGNGSVRYLDISIPDGFFEVSPNEDLIEYRLKGPVIFEYLSRKKSGNIYSISGGDVECFESGNYIIMKNSFIEVNFTKFGSKENHITVDTSKIINWIKTINANSKIEFVNTSITIDDDATTRIGTGYVTLLKERDDGPLCIVEAFLNTTPSYKVRYILFSGADFMLIKVITNGDRIEETFDFKTTAGYDIYKRNDFLAYYNTTYLFSPLFLGSYLISIKNSTYISGDTIQSFGITQDIEGNKILLIFTKTTLEDFEEELKGVRRFGMENTRFGRFSFTVPDETNIYLILLYYTIDLDNVVRWGRGSHELSFRNDDGRIKVGVK